MPRRSVLSGTERASLLTMPDEERDWIQYYAFDETDHSLIRQRRGAANRLGFAVQLCVLRYPGTALTVDIQVGSELVAWIAQQIGVNPTAWNDSASRDETRREHLQEIRDYLNLASFGAVEFRILIRELTKLALQTDKGLVLAAQALSILRRQQVVVPAVPVLERACTQAITRANRRIYEVLTNPLSRQHKQRLDALLTLKPETNITWLVWLRQSPFRPNSSAMLEHIERLRTFQRLDLPPDIAQDVHHNRLLKMAREGGRVTAKDLSKFEVNRRRATLVALAIEGMATVTDEIVDLHDRILIKLFATARNKHQLHFQQEGKAINDKVRLYAEVGRALVDARATGADPYAAIELVMPWQAFADSVNAADHLARPVSFDHLHLVSDQFPTLRRYAPQLLEVLNVHPAPAAQKILDAVDTLKDMNSDSARLVPDQAPTQFVKPRWQPLVFRDGKIDRRNYEICALSEFKNSLRSGDIWVEGSRQFRHFDDYLLPAKHYQTLKLDNSLPLPVESSADRYLEERVQALERQLTVVNQLASLDQLPDAILTDVGLRLTPQETTVPAAAQQFINQVSARLPRIKITDLLMDVDDWTGFTR